jgi:hypothetical protein
MPQICDRAIIRQSLEAISADTGTAMRDAGLSAIPVYVVIPNSGTALVTVMTPLDPADADWDRVMENACQVIQAKLGTDRLHTRGMAWTTANEPRGGRDVTAGPIAVSAEGPTVVS